MDIDSEASDLKSWSRRHKLGQDHLCVRARRIASTLYTYNPLPFGQQSNPYALDGKTQPLVMKF
eukprot:scaffold6634_cov158-Amphora_coffeaeformis.AAC.11